jgi:hypothetical protein
VVVTGELITNIAKGHGLFDASAILKLTDGRSVQRLPGRRIGGRLRNRTPRAAAPLFRIHECVASSGGQVNSNHVTCLEQG